MAAGSGTSTADNIGASQGFIGIRRRFGFRSIGIGNWVTREEQARAAHRFESALVDLMRVLRGPQALISLRGNLSLNYGIGGQPGVAAHYEPARRCLALAKNAGPGSLAHEWFHALDHYLADKAFHVSAPGIFASRAWLQELPVRNHPLNTRLLGCFRAIMINSSGDKTSELFRLSTRADEATGTPYYSQPEELAARAFEAFVQDRAPGNSFLVSGTKATREARMGLYPRGAERQRINHAFETYFHALGPALNRTG